MQFIGASRGDRRVINPSVDGSPQTRQNEVEHTLVLAEPKERLPKRLPNPSQVETASRLLPKPLREFPRFAGKVRHRSHESFAIQALDGSADGIRNSQDLVVQMLADVCSLRTPVGVRWPRHCLKGEELILMAKKHGVLVAERRGRRVRIREKLQLMRC